MKLKLLYTIIEKMQYNNLGKYIRQKRIHQKKSLNEFAFECGLEPATLCRFETGKSDILLNNFIKIAIGFNSTPSKLLSEFEEKS